MDDVMSSILKAANFAALKHRSQRRKDPEATPYINHPIGVAWLLVEAGVRDTAVVQAALLHDTLEDTDTQPSELLENFGEHVNSIVAEVTDDKNLPKAERKRLQEVHAGNCSTEAKLVKLADKLYNCTDLTRARPVGWDEARVMEYLSWSRRVLDAGLRGVNSHLETRLDAVLDQHLGDKTVGGARQQQEQD